MHASLPLIRICLHFQLDTTSQQGGTGATSFGAAGDANPALANDAQHNVLDAIVRWVEQGIPPDQITAAHYTNNNASQGVDFTRPICKVCGMACGLGERERLIPSLSSIH